MQTELEYKQQFPDFYVLFFNSKYQNGYNL